MNQSDLSALNDSQKDVVNARGFVRVDAGPGTGKTETMSYRFMNIIESGISPSDILLVTFTRNGASEMKQRLSTKLQLSGLNISPKEIRVDTFDALCNSILKESTKSVSVFFETDDILHDRAKMVENHASNLEYFRRTITSYPCPDELKDTLYVAIKNCKELFTTVEKMMIYGILPKKDGWFGLNHLAYLHGDGEKVFSKLKNMDMKALCEEIIDILDKDDTDFPEELSLSIREDNLIEDSFFKDAALDERSKEIKLVHDLYYNYIVSAIRDDWLTFGLISTFAYITLYENERVRDAFGCKYLMIDEFQDTDCNQLMIALMLLKEPELCVIGDYRQSIFGFRNTSPEYILDFIGKSKSLENHLVGKLKIKVPEESVDIPLKCNYRSFQRIIDTFMLIMKNSDESEYGGKIDDVEIKSRYDKYLESKIELVCRSNRDEENEEVASRVKHYVKSGVYQVYDPKNKCDRDPKYGDIAVLCRSNNAAREIYMQLLNDNIPAFLNGDLNIMRTNEARLILAWLRYMVEIRDERALTAILVREGYRQNTVVQFLNKKKDIPDKIIDFRRCLRENDLRPLKLVTLIEGYYGDMDPDVVSAISDAIMNVFDETACTVSDLIGFIERNMDSKFEMPLDKPIDKGAVLVETIHKSKGSEYPIVIIPRVNRQNFPRPNDSKKVSYYFSKELGIRSLDHVVQIGDDKHDVKSWKTVLAMEYIGKSIEEERRMMFVALSRAKQYITVVATKKDVSCFYTELESMQTCDVVEPLQQENSNSDEIHEKKKHITGLDPFNTSHSKEIIGVHEIADIIQEDSKSVYGGKGAAYGNIVHHVAELMICNLSLDYVDDIEPKDLDVLDHVIADLRSRGFSMQSELECRLPVDGVGVILNGVIDLLAIGEGAKEIEIHDWKTDVDLQAHRKAYTMQISIYYHVVKLTYPDAKIRCYLDYICASPDNPSIEVKPFDMDEVMKAIDLWKNKE